MLLYQTLEYIIHGKTETLTTWNKKIELPDRSYYTSDIEKLKIIVSISIKKIEQ